jgi:protein SCO1/2
MPPSWKVTEPLKVLFRSSVLCPILGFCVLAIAVWSAGCRPAEREYELRGVVVSVDASRQEITIKHEDIPRFMPGMTMPFKVRDGNLLVGRVPGDLVRARLVVEDSNGYLRTLERVGSAPVLTTPAAPLTSLLNPGDEVPKGTFIDQTGKRRTLADWRGRAIAVTFIYTRCPLPNFCPLMDQHFRRVQDGVAQQPEMRERIHLLSVSFDPEFDRPKVLAAHAQRLGADPGMWTFLSGDPKAIEAFAAPFGMSVIRERDSPQDIVHNLRTAVIDPDGRLVTILGGTEWTPDDLVVELRKALAR